MLIGVTQRRSKLFQVFMIGGGFTTFWKIVEIMCGGVLLQLFGVTGSQAVRLLLYHRNGDGSDTFFDENTSKAWLTDP